MPTKNLLILNCQVCAERGQQRYIEVKKFKRIRDMLAQGWIDEVKGCQDIVQDRQLPAAKAMGMANIVLS